jgi:hypothetical protein
LAYLLILLKLVVAASSAQKNFLRFSPSPEKVEKGNKNQFKKTIESRYQI